MQKLVRSYSRRTRMMVRGAFVIQLYGKWAVISQFLLISRHLKVVQQVLFIFYPLSCGFVKFLFYSGFQFQIVTTKWDNNNYYYYYY